MQEVNKLIDRLSGNYTADIVFGEYDIVFPFTNECVSGCLNLIDLEGKDCGLTVLSSGDHLFSLIEEGITTVDTFDINRVTEYYALGLKRTMILNYSYRQFIEVLRIINYQIHSSKSIGKTISFDKKHDIIKQVVFDLSKDMDPDYRKFWISFIDSYDKLYKDKKLTEDFFIPVSKTSIKGISYLKDEDSYNRLKNSLGSANIRFRGCDISEVPSMFEGNMYDVIMLSNILDYSSKSLGIHKNLSVLNGFIGSIEEKCNDDSYLFLNYIMPWRNDISKSRYENFFASFGMYYPYLNGFEVHDTTNSLSKEAVVLKKKKK